MKEIILPDGTLDASRIWRRETLYTGMNGKSVERVYLSPEHSIIYKPLTNESQLGQEGWVYEHILQGMAFPPIYPQLLAASGIAAGDQSWQLFEDLGALRHAFDEETALDLIDHIAWWHALPVEHLSQQPLLGPKPYIETIAEQVLGRRDELTETLTARFETPQFVIDQLDALTRSSRMTTYWERDVLSHGDLHLGNYARAEGAVRVLDWEHAHINSRYWDLYYVIDSSHPDFPKSMSIPVRKRLLDRYLAQSAVYGIQLDAPLFLQGYYLFTTWFSLWMLLLIAGDLERIAAATSGGRWSVHQLTVQLEETLDSLTQCVQLLNEQGVS
ncbi:phosphotransferase family enzyme [Paenibacillus taihuensis]|uniref:Phosphotransferase family enzyme n=1 Tax=Paenibacillus taihuensis TaxID=1156355 RepID=A0A3D9SCQ2_9BACL|nr:phosphotransferase [Paenibacillus taihuensis]REE86419.1 phosphotransferase family enzyme [Paenibacillus taihuensis]